MTKEAKGALAKLALLVQCDTGCLEALEGGKKSLLVLLLVLLRNNNHPSTPVGMDIDL